MSSVPNLLLNSPSRISHAKRKMPESFYRPPVQKTQLFSASEILPRSIHHSHTNSLPVETPIPPVNTLNSTLSVNNLYDKSNAIKPPQMAYYPQQNDLPRGISPLVGKQEQQYFHSKTYSLPCTFDPLQQQNPNYMNSPQNFGPPMRSHNPNGDIPLPPGWSAEKTSSGQTYFINHFLKTTTWEDPRKLYNLPTNQNEISNDLRSTITKTIPLPSGWEEARTANGEVYFINHFNKTTCWEDPRINIYMQQEQQKIYSAQQYNDKSMHVSMGQNQAHYMSSQSSLSSSSASISSSNSSIPSMSGSNSTLNRLPSGNFEINYQQIQNQNLPNLTNKTPQEKVEILKKGLDEVSQQKAMICKQLGELSRLENNLKSKLSPQDLEDVLNRLKLNDNKMGSFSSFENQPVHNKKNETTPLKSQSLVKGPDGELDSTILADSISNNQD